ncbi:MAG: NUDIX hydrolase [Pirellulaceae bacterium]|nr:NUDIX hydrolase [Pirellulaceae bacterium]
MSAIRILAICVFRHGSKVLVAQGFDAVKEESFLRPLGGAVEFGELAADALRREIREELAAEIAEVVQIGVLENIFTYRGQPGHEIVLVFDARFVDQEFYQKDSLAIHEEDIWDGPARWVDLNDDLPFDLYPDGLAALLRNAA